MFLQRGERNIAEGETFFPSTTGSANRAESSVEEAARLTQQKGVMEKKKK